MSEAPPISERRRSSRSAKGTLPDPPLSRSGSRRSPGALELSRQAPSDRLFLVLELRPQLVGDLASLRSEQPQANASTLERSLEIRRRFGFPPDASSIPPNGRGHKGQCDALERRCPSAQQRLDGVEVLQDQVALCLGLPVVVRFPRGNAPEQHLNRGA